MSITTQFLFLFLFTFSAQVAQAHPHIWAYTDVEILTDSNQITGLKVLWKFDELYSVAFLQDADLNKNMKLEKSETEYAIQTVFKENPESLFPFIYLRFNGKTHTFKFQNPTIWMAEDETLHYQFSIILDQPAPINGTHDIGFFDPEFYISFEQSYDLTLPQHAICKYELEENKNISIYGGLVNPETYKINCAGA
tara:strand:+ start:154878 stop:155462 length:585 start_codon:yes stop_codon:yes gene_type:complete